MNNWNCFLIIITFISISSCSNSNYIEYDNKEKTISNLTDNYYLKSVEITELVQSNNTLKLLDSNKSTIKQHGGRAIDKLNLLHLNNNYTSTGAKTIDLLKKENLHFKVTMSKYEMWKLRMESDFKVIIFKSSDLVKVKNEFSPQ